MDAPLLPFSDGCIFGRLICREKRFFTAFAHNGETLWAHTNNSGAMLGLLRPGLPVFVSPARKPGRKLPFTLELISPTPPPPGSGPFHPLSASPWDSPWVGVNTLTPNRLLRAAFEKGHLPFAEGYTRFAAEVKYGDSRLDALLTGPGLPPLWIECKNVSLVEDNVAAFPDAETARGRKHLRALAELAAAGARAALFYCIQRTDTACFAPADYIDPAYAALFHTALRRGVEVYPFTATAGPGGYGLGRILPVLSENG
ncbi:MAG: DNA/RNA nuclease SfsA [Desulfovibrio sp.]|jgi:sugar fermentation stimulation protein A|nr:DNA/RNA nuclease SfsA [Desulfovibrio sp.]